MVPTLSPDDNVDDAFAEYEENVRKDEIKEFSYEVGVTEDFVKENIAEYEYSGIINHSELSNNVKGGLLVKRKKIKRIKDFIIGNVRKYS